ncbi:MAG TPA: response regulator [Burkholderiales bacterium]|nr:response regulator [Burkholderiales bacterium]
MADRSYRITATGKHARASDDTAIPTDYRRLLALIEAKTHFNVIRGRLREYPDPLLEEWLAELEELGFVETLPAESGADLDFTDHFTSSRPSGPRVLPQDAERLKRAAAEAGTALERSGLFLARGRIANRPPTKRAPAQTTVLIVEDDPDQLALADLRVSMAGYKVRVARTAAELLTELRTQQAPDIMLLDVMLPDGDGFDILGKIRSHRKLALLPVVMLTAKTEREDIERGLALGADAYVTKPYSKSVLVDAIRQVLRTG